MLPTIDLIALGVGLFAVLSGLVMGFGKVLKLITNGFIGKIFTLVICYFLFGIVLKIGFVQELLAKLILTLSEKGNIICNLLIKLRIDLIALAVALFVVVLIINKLLVGLIKKFFEMDNKVMRVINKTFGVVLMCAFIVVLGLVAFQVLFWLTGAQGGVYAFLEGSKFGIDKIYLNNPLNTVIEGVKATFQIS